MLWDQETKQVCAEIDFMNTITDLKVVGGWVVLIVNQMLLVFDFEAESGLETDFCKI